MKEVSKEYFWKRFFNARHVLAVHETKRLHPYSVKYILTLKGEPETVGRIVHVKETSKKVVLRYYTDL